MTTTKPAPKAMPTSTTTKRIQKTPASTTTTKPAPKTTAEVVKAKQAKDAARLKALAPKITTEHKAALTTYRKGLDHARECGKLLAEAKEIVSNTYGLYWTKWLTTNTTMSRQHAGNYIRVAERWDDIMAKWPEADTVRGALALLRTKRPKDGEKPAKPKKVPVSFHTVRAAAEAEGLDLDKMLLALFRAGIILTMPEAPDYVSQLENSTRNPVNPPDKPARPETTNPPAPQRPPAQPAEPYGPTDAPPAIS